MSSEDSELFMIPSSGKVIIDFYADWCGPCKRISPYFEELKEKHKDVMFLKCNIDECPKIAKDYNITSIPAFVTLQDGKQIGFLLGANTSKLDSLLQDLLKES